MSVPSKRVVKSDTVTGPVVSGPNVEHVWPMPSGDVLTGLTGLADPAAILTAVKEAKDPATLDTMADTYVRTYVGMGDIVRRGEFTQTYAGAYAYTILKAEADLSTDGKIEVTHEDGHTSRETVNNVLADRLGFSRGGGRPTQLKNVARLIFDLKFQPGDDDTARLTSAAQRMDGFGKAIDSWKTKEDAVGWHAEKLAEKEKDKAITRGPGKETAAEKEADKETVTDTVTTTEESPVPDDEPNVDAPVLSSAMTRGRMLTTLAELVVTFGAPKDGEEYARLTEIRDAIAVALDASDIAGE